MRPMTIQRCAWQEEKSPLQQEHAGKIHFHHNWGGIVRSDWPLLLSMTFTHCGQREKTTRTTTHILWMSCADGKDTPDKLWNIALGFFPFWLLLEQCEMLARSAERRLSFSPYIAMIPQRDVGTGKKACCPQDTAEASGKGGELFYLKTFLPPQGIWYPLMEACANFSSILSYWASLDWGDAITDVIAHIPRQCWVNRNGTRTTARETLHSTSKKLNFLPKTNAEALLGRLWWMRASEWCPEVRGVQTRKDVKGSGCPVAEELENTEEDIGSEVSNTKNI